MIDGPTRCATRVFVALNPRSGTCSAEDVRQALARHFDGDGGGCEVFEIGEGSDLAGAVRRAVESGTGLVIAAGGDGTVSSVAAGVVGKEVPLGIIPLGTANVLAGELGIPLDLEGACALLSGEHD